VISLKNPTSENKQTLEKIGEGFIEFTEGKWTYGWTGEDSNKAIVIAAWDSVEVRFGSKKTILRQDDLQLTSG
jgi:hypothetical protein